MKTSTIQRLGRGFSAFLLFFGLQVVAKAQDKVQVNEETISAWFARNWMWVAAGVVLLVLIALFSRGSSRRKTTTIVKDDVGNVRSVTTTEIKE